jgi:hypothetical protein
MADGCNDFLGIKNILDECERLGLDAQIGPI